MAYLCPVCGVEQPDAEHLAHHLAITAALHEDDHETWLEDLEPDWPEHSPDELGPAVLEHAEETEHAHDVGQPEGVAETHEHPDPPPQQPRSGSTDGLDPLTAQVLDEARTLTERRRTDRNEEADASESPPGAPGEATSGEPTDGESDGEPDSEASD